jgi:peptidoglycan hydrolase-like protein with peptidoglycan-binding domain
MSLNRVWIPSPNYSGRGGSGVRLVVVHTTQGGGTDTYQSLGNYFANSASQVSSHVGIDDTPGTVGEYVAPDQKAWTAADANPYAIQGECCAMAEWTAEWSAHPQMLANCAAWIAEECARFGIPIRKIGESQAAAGEAGVCGHADLGYAGNDHWDPGPAFPWGDVLAMAGGTAVDLGPSSPSSPPVAAGEAPPWPGRYLDVVTQGADVSTWQGQMQFRGWAIDVDGIYGPASADVCSSFQREKGIAVDGIVGPETWAASWTAPVT